MKIVRLSPLLLVFVLACASPAPCKTSPGAAINRYLSALVPFGFSGNALVAVDGKVVLHRGYGLADRERGVPMRPDTVVSIGSITKQFTAAAILKLQDEKRLGVDDPISRYLPGVPKDKAAITVRELLTHTAGLQPDYGGSDYEKIGRDAYVARVMAAPLESRPGTAFDYSNAGYSLLAAIVERVSKEPYERFLRDELFVPAGMYDTGYRLARWNDNDIAVGYRDDVRWGTIPAHGWSAAGPYWNLMGNGGIESTPADMFAWSQALRAGRVLSAAAVKAMQAGYVWEGPEHRSQYGFGWSIQTTRHGKLVTHNGGNGIYAADFLRFVDSNTVIYIASNESAIPATTVSATLARIAFGGAAPAIPAVVSLDARSLDIFGGAYDGNDAARLNISPVNGSLIVATSDPALFAALLPAPPLPPDLVTDVGGRVKALYADAQILGYEPLDGDIGVWVRANAGGRPTTMRLRFGPRRMLGMLVGESPSVTFRPTGPRTFAAYNVNFGLTSTLRFTDDGVDITSASGMVTHLHDARVTTDQAPTGSQTLAEQIPLVHFSDGAVIVPMSLKHNLPVVTAMVGSKGPFHFAIETGAPFIAVSQRVIDALALKPIADGDPPLYQLPSIEIGGLSIELPKAIPLHAADSTIDGVIGLNAYASLLLTLDYPAATATFERGALPAANGEDILTSPRVAFGFGIPVSIGGVESDAFMDTRSTTSMSVSPETAKTLSFTAPPRTVGMAHGAAFAAVPVEEAQLSGSVQIGAYTLKQPTISIVLLPPFLPQQPLVGAQILKNFVVTLDETSDRIRLELPGGGTIVP